MTGMEFKAMLNLKLSLSLAKELVFESTVEQLIKAKYSSLPPLDNPPILVSPFTPMKSPGIV